MLFRSTGGDAGTPREGKSLPEYFYRENLPQKDDPLEHLFRDEGKKPDAPTAKPAPSFSG